MRQRTKSASTGKRSRLNSSENESNSQSIGDDENDLQNEEDKKKAWQVQSHKNLVVKNSMEGMGWYWEHSRLEEKGADKSMPILLKFLVQFYQKSKQCMTELRY